MDNIGNDVRARPDYSGVNRNWIQPRVRRQGRRVATKVSLGILTLVLAGVTLLAYQVAAVREHLEHALSLAPQMRSELEDGDIQSAKQTFAVIAEKTTKARATATGPLWQIASYVPIVGPNFAAAGEVTVSADDVVSSAVAPLLDNYHLLDWKALSPKDGRVDPSALKEAAPALSTAANTVQLSYERMNSVDLSRLVTELADPISSATDQLHAAAAALRTASSAAKLVPAILGSDGPRNYLVLVQNNAEARATGGIPGALAVISTEDGYVSLGEQDSASALGVFSPSLEVDNEQVSLYSARLGSQMQNVNLTPHFPTAAKTAKMMWEKRHNGLIVDGVIALDPIVLSYLLEATGPVALTDPEVLTLIRGTALPSSLTGANVVPTLLSDVYREIENPEAQDIYFAAVASQVFTAFTDGEGDGDRLVTALTSSALENRLYMWSSHASEQTIIASTPLHGSVTGPDTGGAAFGVYFNDSTGAKMDYYANRSVQLLQTCQLGDYSEYTVRVSAANNAPADAGTSLPDYVTGNGAFGVEPGKIRTNYVVYGPAQSFVETASVNGEPVSVGSGKHGQRPVGTVQLELDPGESVVLDIIFSRVVQNSEPRVKVTPSVHPLEDVLLPFERRSC